MTDDELKRLFDAMRQESTAAHTETRRHFDVAADAMRQENADTRHHFDVAADAMRQENADTRRHFDVTVEHMEKRFDLLAESVVHLDDELQRTRTSLSERIDRTAAETQAMIKFSHKELDRRLTALEESQRTLDDAVADLQARLERLEGSTH